MKLEAYSVYDKAVGAFLPPLFVRSRGEAVRSFSDAVNNKEHQFSRHMMDYVLMAVGSWSDETGVFAPIEPVRVLGAHEVLVPDGSPSGSES